MLSKVSRRAFLYSLAAVTTLNLTPWRSARQALGADTSQNLVFYFTATGNSLYVAKRLTNEALSIPQELKKTTREYTADTIGIVCPVYSGELPKIVRRFLQGSTFKADYFYIILTYGNHDSVAGEWASNFAQSVGIHVDYANTVLMVDNYLPAFDMDEQKKIDKKIEEQLVDLFENIKNQKKGIPEPTEEGRQGYARVLKRNTEHPEINGGNQITITDACVGCGICGRVCPVANFYLKDGKAMRRQETCEFCLACAHNCPQKAITLNISDKNPQARFRNEHVSLADIIRANRQG